MKRKKRFLRHLGKVALAAGLLGGASAYAGQVIEFVATPLWAPDPDSPDWPATLLVPLFDPSLGTLTEIEFSFTTTATGQVGFENRQPGASNTIDYELPLNAGFLLPTLPASTVQNLILTGSSGVLGSSDGVTDFGGTSGTTVNLTPVDVTSSATIIEAARFGAYTRSGAPGTFDVLVSLDRGSVEVAGNGTKLFSYAELVQTQVRVQVTYTYSSFEVPEARGWIGAFGVTALLIGGHRRRHRNRTG